jgi:AraC family transcriptional regulator
MARVAGSIRSIDIVPIDVSTAFASEHYFTAVSSVDGRDLPEYSLPNMMFVVHVGTSPHLTHGTIDGKRFADDRLPEQLAYLPRGARIRSEWKGNCKSAWVELYPSLIETVTEGKPLHGLPELFPSRPSDRLIRDLVLLISGHRRSAHTDDPLYKELLVARLVAHLQSPPTFPDWALTLHKSGYLTPRALKRAMAYVDDRIGLPITLQAWAGEIGLSQFYFARSFKATTGLSPYQYVIERKVLFAKVLLASRLSVTEVAARLCFSGSSHFGAVFKERVGLTPSAWVAHTGRNERERIG